jgi:hypothetical protein
VGDLSLPPVGDLLGDGCFFSAFAVLALFASACLVEVSAALGSSRSEIKTQGMNIINIPLGS